MRIVQDAILQADQSGSALSDLHWRDRILAAIVLLWCVWSGKGVNEALEAVDPDCELSEAGHNFVMLHFEEPIEGILGITTHLLLHLPVESNENGLL